MTYNIRVEQPQQNTLQIKTQKSILNHLMDEKIQFEETLHKYNLVDDRSLQFTSVTTVNASILFGEFSGSHIKSPIELMGTLAAWKCSALYGTLVHGLLEELFVALYETEEKCPLKTITKTAAYHQWCKKYNVDGGAAAAATDKLNGYNLLLKHYGGIDKLVSNFERMARIDAIQYEKKGIDNLNVEDMVNVLTTFVQSQTFTSYIVDAVSNIVDFFVDPKQNLPMWQDDWQLLYPEYIVYDREWAVAGSIDLLLWTNKEKREVAICDWKTNRKDIEGRGYRIQCNNSPFHGDTMNQLEKYHCQLHLYAAILERNYNVTVTHLLIGHIFNGVTIHEVPHYRSIPPHNKKCQCISRLKYERRKR